ncbi:lysozyme inhibitor LprI family protein, partial [Aeromonas rivipollensis]|uniref:lysozyme inhibitor LprI family protein n=1 Tax=Aeromonas rivipollensis TaxID=948519 RepID=UPI003D19C59B
MTQKLHFFLLLASLPITAFSASFDCSKASSPMEKNICGNEVISYLDSTLSTVYKKAVSKNPSVRDEQRKWIKERNLCKTDDCLIDSYQSRIDMLKHSDLVAQIESTTEPTANSAPEPTHETKLEPIINSTVEPAPEPKPEPTTTYAAEGPCCTIPKQDGLSPSADFAQLTCCR